MNDVERKKCNRCKVNLPLNKYKLKRCGNYTKECLDCAKKRAEERERYKCEHGRQRCRCKKCGGSCLCKHDRPPHRCKECGGSGICEHGIRRSTCKECGGSDICEHNTRRSRCKECGGSSICKHNIQRYNCKDCGGNGICEHNIQRTFCKECGGGSICEHGGRRHICKKCGGGSICEHNIQRTFCKECDLPHYLGNVVRCRIKHALKSNKNNHSIEYLGCGIDDFKKHIEAQFKDGMTWDNHGEWHIDHIIPIKYKEDGVEPTIEEVYERLHYTNTQPLWASDNMAKGNRFIG